MLAVMASHVSDISAYVAEKRRLLSLERDAEAADVAAASSSAEALSSLEAAGTAVTRLSFVGRRSTAGGRVVVELGTRGGREVSTRLSSGDIVSVRPHHQAKASGRGAGKAQRKKGSSGVDAGDEGVLAKVEGTGLEVVLEDETPAIFGGEDPSTAHDLAGQLFAVVRIGSDVTFKRCNAALSELEKACATPSHPAHAICSVLYRGRDPRFENDAKLQLSSEQTQVLASLNEVQLAAVRRALCSKDVFAIHGPPGTGKTSTLVSYIAAEILRGSRVLVVAPSNVAVDNIAEKLASVQCGSQIKFVRAGHPARVMESVSEHTLEARLAATDEMSLARDIRAELAALDDRVQTSRGAARRALRMEQRVLRKELRKREKDALDRLLGRVPCVLATATGAGGLVLDRLTAAKPFDIVCLDEAGMATESSALVAVLKGKRVVLAGDPWQLAPTVTCDTAKAGGLDRTLLDVLFANKSLHDATVRMLVIQYRMNSVISNWSSHALYEGRLVADDSVAHRTLNELLPGHETSTDGDLEDHNEEKEKGVLEQPWVLIDTSSCGYFESGDDGSSGSVDGGKDVSKSNQGEADLVVAHVRRLLAAGLSEQAIGVISPYSGQVTLLRAKLREAGIGRGLEISTVDAFQGREKEAVVISLVRSNENASVGFLKDSRRLNVAITRAKRHVALVCDSSTVSNDPFCSDMIDYASEKADYQVADAHSVEFREENFIASVPAKESTKSSQQPGPRKRSVNNSKDSRKQPRRRPSVKSTSAVPRETENFAPRAAQSSGSVGLEEQMKAFEQDPTEKTKAFPTSLSAGERRVVHALAEELGLLHVTTGEGKHRFITVTKPPPGTDGTPPLVEVGVQDRVGADSLVQVKKHEKGVRKDQPIARLDSKESSQPSLPGGQFHVLLEDDAAVSCDGGSDFQSSPAANVTSRARPGNEESTNAAVCGRSPDGQSGTEGPSIGEQLREAERARQSRRDHGDGTASDLKTNANASGGTSSSSSSTQRIIIDGQLVGSSRAQEHASHRAARARLNNRLAEKAEGRKKKTNKKT